MLAERGLAGFDLYQYLQYEDPLLGATEALQLRFCGDPRFEFNARRTLHAFLPAELRAARRAALAQRVAEAEAAHLRSTSVVRSSLGLLAGAVGVRRPSINVTAQALHPSWLDDLLKTHESDQVGVLLHGITDAVLTMLALSLKLGRDLASRFGVAIHARLRHMANSTRVYDMVFGLQGTMKRLTRVVLNTVKKRLFNCPWAWGWAVRVSIMNGYLPLIKVSHVVSWRV